MSACIHGGTTERRIDGEWIEVACDPDSPWVCWTHKMQHMRGEIRRGRNGLDGGATFRKSCEGNYTQAELLRETVDAAKAGGYEIQRAR